MPLFAPGVSMNSKRNSKSAYSSLVNRFVPFGWQTIAAPPARSSTL